MSREVRTQKQVKEESGHRETSDASHPTLPSFEEQLVVF